jgi:hypothetical protein
VAGECLAAEAAALEAAAPARLVGKLGPFLMSAFARGQCSSAHEGYPERSLNAPANLFMSENHGPSECTSPVPHDCPLYNWSPNGSTWGKDIRSTPTVSGCIRADPWTTTSGASGLDYASWNLLTGSDCSGPACLGIAATRNARFSDGNPNNDWLFPARCVGRDRNVDGPAIHYDPAGKNLWAAYLRTDSSQFKLLGMRNCLGAPGSATCPVQVDKVITSSLSGHANVIVNPVTHNAIVAWREGNRILAQFVRPDGSTVPCSTFCQGGALVLASSSRFASNSQGSVLGRCLDGQVFKCGGIHSTDCTSGTRCSRLVSRVQMATRWDPALQRNLAYFAWDDSYTKLLPNGRRATRFRATLRILDITDESAPFPLFQTRSTFHFGAENHFGSIVAVNEFTSQVGWFFYRQRGDKACDTVFQGLLSKSLTFGSPVPVQLSNSFPTMVVHATMGDYVGTVRRGLPGGWLLASWAQPVPTTGSNPFGNCPPCGASRHSLVVEGTLVRLN